MKITRDVIYDLLPAYFAGEVSADTRALIDEFLTADPEFSRMTARFQRLFEERGTTDAGEVSAERTRLERARGLFVLTFFVKAAPELEQSTRFIDGVGRRGRPSIRRARRRLGPRNRSSQTHCDDAPSMHD